MSTRNDEPQELTDAHGRVWRRSNLNFGDGKVRYTTTHKVTAATAQEIRSLSKGTDFRH